MRKDLSPDVLIIGAGAAGLSAAAISSMLGARTMLVEKHRLGGDCTWTGCVPSKTLLDASRRWKIATSERGRPHPKDHDHAFVRAMNRVRETRESIYRHADSPERFTGMGVDVRIGKARFVDHRQIRIDGPDGISDHRPRYVMVATGSHPGVPDIRGLERVPYLTTDSVFELAKRPKSLVVVGGGPSGVELSQSFVRFGVDVTLLEREEQILGAHLSSHADGVARSLRDEGVDVRTGVRIKHVDQVDGRVRVVFSSDDAPVEASQILVVTGRTASTEGLGLDVAGVRQKGHLLDVNRSCRTNQRHVYGIGDVATSTRSTPAAGAMARTAVLRALFKVPGSFDAATLPAVVYTDPGLGRVGLADDGKGGVSSSEMTISTGRLDRALIDRDPEGEIRMRMNRWGRIVGAHVLSARAGEVIGLLSALISQGVKLSALSDTIMPYPTYSDVMSRAGSRVLADRIPDRLIRVAAALTGLRGEHAGFDPDEIG